jgi:hypothetical protein
MALIFTLTTFLVSISLVGYLFNVSVQLLAPFAMVALAVVVANIAIFYKISPYRRGETRPVVAPLEQPAVEGCPHAKAVELRRRLDECGVDVDDEDIQNSEITHHSPTTLGVYMGGDIYEFVIVNGKYIYEFESTTTRDSKGMVLHQPRLQELITENCVVYVYTGRVDDLCEVEQDETPVESLIDKEEKI